MPGQGYFEYEDRARQLARRLRRRRTLEEIVDPADINFGRFSSFPIVDRRTGEITVAYSVERPRPPEVIARELLKCEDFDRAVDLVEELGRWTST